MNGTDGKIIKSTMTSRERMIAAMRNQVPDCVPVAPDLSNMVPCKLTGKPFWSIYLHEDPPLWQAYLKACHKYAMDGWFIYAGVTFKDNSHNQLERRIIRQDDHRIDELSILHTPAGDLQSVTVYPADNPPTLIEKMIKDFEQDFHKLRYLFPPITGYDASLFRNMKRAFGDDGIACEFVAPPGLHIFHEYFHGNLAAATFAYYDRPDLFLELCAMFEKRETQKLEILLDLGADSILTGGSGSVTMQSPAIWRELSLPAIQKYTRLCREAGVISGIHSCGKEYEIVKACARETDLDYINPLEIPPMGDCNLLELKQEFGKDICLMGNLQTTEVMLFGSPDLVRLRSLEAIRDAGSNGGFILSTGDQCGRDTPEANLHAIVQTAREYGQYPLSIDRIENEIGNLQRKLAIG